MKKILIVDSRATRENPLFNIFEELGRKDFAFYFFGNKASFLYKKFLEKHWPAETSFFLPLKRQPVISTLLFPLSFFFYFALLARLKFKHGIEELILWNEKEKTFFTPAGRILKIRSVWMEAPENPPARFGLFYRLNSRAARLVASSSAGRERILKKGLGGESVSVIQPGIRLNLRERQDNIFSGLAQADAKFKRSFFTVGTVVELDKKQRVESLLKAIKICLPVIPNLQLIIVGEGEERKNLGWLAKKMGIDTMSWFVGRQNHLRKWLDSFDVYVETNELPGAADLETVLRAMEAGLPVIGPNDSDLGDIVHENKTGSLIELDNSEMLARQIIKLYKDKKLRLKIGELARERVTNHFTAERQIAEFEHLFV